MDGLRGRVMGLLPQLDFLDHGWDRFELQKGSNYRILQLVREFAGAVVELAAARYEFLV